MESRWNLAIRWRRHWPDNAPDDPDNYDTQFWEGLTLDEAFQTIRAFSHPILDIEMDPAGACEMIPDEFPRANELAFERAARDFYLVSREDSRQWLDLRPELRAYWRQRLMQAVISLDGWVSREVERAECSKGSGSE